MSDEVSGWGRTPVARTRLLGGLGRVELERAVLDASPRGIAPRGVGRSYGDAAQRTNGTTVTLRHEPAIEWVDHDTDLVRVGGSATIADMIEFADRVGSFVPVTPGTRHVTVGGAIAADVHGKDHHVAGSFGHHVERLTLMLADGTTRAVSREADGELFRATLGGMGLTGLILDADVRLLPVAGNRIEVETYRSVDLAATMEAMTAAESTHRYSVAWIDLMARGARMGRGVVTNGNHAHVADHDAPLSPELVSVPRSWPVGLVGRVGVRAFNEAWFRKAPAKPTTTIERYDGFFYPLDAVGRWNLLYGPRGFLQYQFALPFESEELLRPIVEELSRSRLPIFLAVLKRFGRAGEGPISFPIPGWTLAMDIPIPADARSLESALSDLDRRVLDGGGRVYLAKDSRMRARDVSAMYPELDRFREIRARVDPERVFQTDLSVRLGL